jgi:chorismate-pyruvate lyase
MPTTLAPKAPQPLDWSALVHPLEDFYAQAGQSLPPLEMVEGVSLPPPYRQLLVHSNDMTPTLEEHYGCTLHIRVLGRRRAGDDYCREVVLVRDDTGRPVEFGANRIRLDLFPAEARRLILAEHEPLGHLMRDFHVTHTCQPNAFLRVASDPTINQALELTGAHVLYGRHNRLFDPRGRLLSEVVEILHPVPPAG